MAEARPVPAASGSKAASCRASGAHGDSGQLVDYAGSAVLAWSVADAADALGIKGQRFAAVESGESLHFPILCCCAVSMTSTWKSSVTGYAVPMRPTEPPSLRAVP